MEHRESYIKRSTFYPSSDARDVYEISVECSTEETTKENASEDTRNSILELCMLNGHTFPSLPETSSMSVNRVQCDERTIYKSPSYSHNTSSSPNNMTIPEETAENSRKCHDDSVLQITSGDSKQRPRDMLKPAAVFLQSSDIRVDTPFSTIIEKKPNSIVEGGNQKCLCSVESSKEMKPGYSSSLADETPETYHCSVCGNTFGNLEYVPSIMLDEHFKRITAGSKKCSDVRYQCKLCEKVLCADWHIRKHLLEHIVDSEATCEDCIFNAQGVAARKTTETQPSCFIKARNKMLKFSKQFKRKQ